MVRAGFPGWKTSRKKEGAACSSRQLRTVVVSVPAGGEGWAGWVVISLHRKGEGKKFGGLLLCSLFLWWQRGYLQLCAFCSRVCFVNCCRQRKVSGLADDGG